MRQIYSLILLDYILIILISKIFCQSSPKNFVVFLNYSSKDNLYYIPLYLDEYNIPKKFFLDTTFPSISLYYNNLTSKENCSANDDCFKNTTILINNTINKNNYEDIIEIVFNTNIKYIIKEEIFFKKEIDGILGLNNGNNTFMDILYDLKIIKEKLFSICLSNKYGYLGLGHIMGINSYLEEQQEINFINLLTSKDYLFELKVNYIKINTIKIEKEFISYLDTSKSLTFFPKNLYDQIITYLLLNNNNLKKDSNGFCQIINSEEKYDIYDNFPDIIINFEDYIFIWKSKNYLYESEMANINKIKLCLTFNELNDDNNIDDKIILGTDFMNNYEIVFDKNNQKIAFINSGCDELFSNKNIERISNNIHDNSNIFIDDIERSSDINGINEDYFNSSNIKPKEEKGSDEYEILINDSISDIPNLNDEIMNSEKSDLLISDVYTDYISDFSTNIIDTTYNKEDKISDTIYETININIATTDEILSTTQNIKEENINEIEKRDIDTTELIKKIDTTIITEKTIQTTEINISTTINEEYSEEENIDIKESEVENKNEGISNNTQIDNQHIVKSGFYEVVKSFLKNKLIYFLLAFLGIIFAFVSIIFISCALISCVKYIQRRRRDYIEQVDVELPRYSKNISTFSDREN